MNSWRLLGYNPDAGLDVNESLSTRRELESVLPGTLEKAAASGSILELESPSGNVLSFGIAEGKGNVHFAQAPRDDGPYFWPVGNSSLSRDDDVVAFYYLGAESEIPLRNCIKSDQVLPIVREFFETDARPMSIEWEEV